MPSGMQVRDGDLRRVPDDRLYALNTIRRNGLHLLQVINDLLDLSKLDAGRLELEYVTCSPRRLVAEVCSLMRMHAGEKGLELLVECCDDLPEHVRTDPTRVRQVLLNLVERMGGVIEVESAPGKGSCFSVLLPLETPEDDAEAEAESRPDAHAAWLERERQPPPELSCRVLRAEDGLDDQRLVQTILERALAARDGAEPFDLILMDLQMPVLDGCDDYVSKPIDRSLLFATLARHLGAAKDDG